MSTNLNRYVMIKWGGPQPGQAQGLQLAELLRPHSKSMDLLIMRKWMAKGRRWTQPRPEELPIIDHNATPGDVRRVHALIPDFLLTAAHTPSWLISWNRSKVWHSEQETLSRC